MDEYDTSEYYSAWSLILAVEKVRASTPEEINRSRRYLERHRGAHQSWTIGLE